MTSHPCQNKKPRNRRAVFTGNHFFFNREKRTSIHFRTLPVVFRKYYVRIHLQFPTQRDSCLFFYVFNDWKIFTAEYDRHFLRVKFISGLCQLLRLRQSQMFQIQLLALGHGYITPKISGNWFCVTHIFLIYGISRKFYRFTK